MDGELPQILIQCTTAKQFSRFLDEVNDLVDRHLKLRREVLNIANIPALTDVKGNFRIYGKARVLEDDKAGAFEYQREQESRNMGQPSIQVRQANSQAEEKEKHEEGTENSTYFKKKLF